MPLTPADIAAAVAARFGLDATDVFVADGEKHPRIHLPAERWRPVAEFLRQDPAVSLDWLACLTGIDYAAEDRMAVVYELSSFDAGHGLAVKVFTPRADPRVPTVADLWPTADWHEREAFDLLGIRFDGHPNLSRILLADDWVGHPLRKDYTFPTEVHGIPGSVGQEWQRPD